MDLGLIAVAIASLVGLLEIASILIVRKEIRLQHDWIESRGTFGDQLHEYLIHRDADDQPTNLEALSTIVGATIAKSMRFGAMQEASVDSRAFNKYDKRIQDAVKEKMPVGYKILFKIAEEVGLDLGEIMEKGELNQFIAAARSNNLGAMLGVDGSNNGQGAKNTW